MKTLKRWKRVFSSTGSALLVVLFFHWLISNYSTENTIIRWVIFCLAVMFLLASLVLRIVKKALAEELDGQQRSK